MLVVSSFTLLCHKEIALAEQIMFDFIDSDVDYDERCSLIMTMTAGMQPQQQEKQR